MKTKDEALDYLVACAVELFEHDPDSSADRTLLDKAVLILRQPEPPTPEASLEALKAVMRLIESGIKHYHDLVEEFRVKLELATTDSHKAEVAIALSEVGGAVSSLSAVLTAIMTDEEFHSVEEVFTGRGLSYPATRTKTGKQLYLPK